MISRTEWVRLQQRAIAAVHSAMEDGSLKRLAGDVKCIDCGDTAIVYDHRDYTKQLTVDPVCLSCNLQRGEALPEHNGEIEIGDEFSFTRLLYSALEYFPKREVMEILDVSDRQFRNYLYGVNEPSHDRGYKLELKFKSAKRRRIKRALADKEDSDGKG